MDRHARRDVSDRVRRAMELVARAELLKFMAHLRREATSEMIRRSAQRLRTRAADRQQAADPEQAANPGQAADPTQATPPAWQPAARRTARCALWCEGACRWGACRARGPAPGPPRR